MKRKAMQHHLDGLLALLLFGIFAVCILAVLLTGANAYKRLTERDQTAFDRRVCVQYLAARVRQADGHIGVEDPEGRLQMADGDLQPLSTVTVEPFGDTEARVLAEDEIYCTRIYWHDGYLMELYADKAGEFQPTDGTPVMEAGGFGMDLSDGLLTLEITSPEGETDLLRLDLRSREGAAA